MAVEEIRKAAAKAGARHKVQDHNVDYKSDAEGGGHLRREARGRGASCLTGPLGADTPRGSAHEVAIPKKVLQITPSASAVQLDEVEDGAT